MNRDIEITYRLTKELIKLRKELPRWAQLFRQDKFTRSNEMEMMQKALEVDKLLRFYGLDWIEEYEKKEFNKVFKK